MKIQNNLGTTLMVGKMYHYRKSVLDAIRAAAPAAVDAAPGD